jgi:hypothetical protein
LSENESREATGAHGLSSSYLSDSNDDDSSHATPLTAEQEKTRRDEIARQREERLKLRLQKRETDAITEQLTGFDNNSNNNNDENSQASHTSATAAPQNTLDFNFKNFFLMNKVLNKILQSKYAWPFKDPVSEEDAPDYNKIIEVTIFYSSNR